MCGGGGEEGLGGLGGGAGGGGGVAGSSRVLFDTAGDSGVEASMGSTTEGSSGVSVAVSGRDGGSNGPSQPSCRPRIYSFHVCLPRTRSP